MNLDQLGATGPQRQAIETLDRPLLLCAGAGSGKTFTLQQRIAYALSPESGPAVQGVDRILAITFTHKAAEEIKSRVRGALRENGMAQEALKVDDAWITTIHGMALRILREHGLELGISPQLAQLDEVRANELLERGFDEVLRDSRNKPESPLGCLLESCGATGKASDARSLVFAVLKRAETLTAGLDAFDFGPAPVSPSAIARQMAAAFAEFLDAGGSAKQMDAAEEGLRQTDALLVGGGAIDWQQLGTLLSELKLPAAQGAAKEAAQELKRIRAMLALECALARGTVLTESLMAAARQVEDAYAALKREEGAVDMADILRIAYRALSQNPQLRDELQCQFQLIMVDEFQDTNQLQIDLIALLCQPGLRNLCTVGDSQQSIYRFQGADVNVYLKHKRQMVGGAGARELHLDANFRSHGDILAFVRKVCGIDGFFSEDFLDLKAGRDEQKAALRSGYRAQLPRITVSLVSYGSKRHGEIAPSAFAKQQEARAIARWFGQLRDAGHRSSDMVLLLGGTTHLDTYSHALQCEGFSCRVEGGSGFFASEESKMVRALLRAMVTTENTQDLFEVLSSEMFLLPADDFLSLGTEEAQAADGAEPSTRRCSIGRSFGARNWSHGECSDRADGGLEGDGSDEEPQLSVLPAPSARVRQIRKIWQRAQEVVRRRGAAPALRQLAADSGYLQRLEQEGVAGQAKAANFLKAVRLVSEMEAQPGCGPAQVAERYSALADSKEKLGSLRGEENNSVRIMTVHSSKGLEFPFVAVADCYSVRPDSGPLRFAVHDGRVDAGFLLEPLPESLKGPLDNLGGEELPGSLSGHWLRLCDEGKREGLLEKRRLFYVATTRASEAMMVSMCVKENKEGLAPTGVQQDVLEALFGEEIPREGTLVPYGGSQPLAYSFLDADRVFNEDSDIVESAAFEGSNRWVEYPVLDSPDQMTIVDFVAQPVPLASYSSLAGEGGVALKEAQELLESAVEEVGTVPDAPDEGLEAWSRMDVEDASGQVPGLAATFEGAIVEGLGAVRESTAEADFGDGSSAESPNGAADRDKATDFGGALHRLCQLDALVGADGARARFDAVADAYGVTDRCRLREAFDRWLVSDVRREARRYSWVEPELSFQAALGTTTLHGEIDLFCAAGPVAKPGEGHALVVDYKTGGHPQETAGQLYAKHRLQALCYAYAVLRQGFSEVTLAFVRVEQDDPLNPGQPQVVRYRFRKRAI